MKKFIEQKIAEFSQEQKEEKLIEDGYVITGGDLKIANGDLVIENGDIACEERMTTKDGLTEEVNLAFEKYYKYDCVDRIIKQFFIRLDLTKDECIKYMEDNEDMPYEECLKSLDERLKKYDPIYKKDCEERDRNKKS